MIASTKFWKMMKNLLQILLMIGIAQIALIKMKMMFQWMLMTKQKNGGVDHYDEYHNDDDGDCIDHSDDNEDTINHSDNEEDSEIRDEKYYCAETRNARQLPEEDDTEEGQKDNDDFMLSALLDMNRNSRTHPLIDDQTNAEIQQRQKMISHGMKFQRMKQMVVNHFSHSTKNKDNDFLHHHKDLKQPSTHDSNYEEEHVFDGEKEEVAIEEMFHYSQMNGDGDETKLQRNLNRTNIIKEESKNLLSQSLMVWVKSVQNEMNSLSAENKKLLQSSKHSSEKIAQLEQELSMVKNKLDRIQPIMHIVQEIVNSSENNTSTKPNICNTFVTSRMSPGLRMIPNAQNDIENEDHMTDNVTTPLMFEKDKAQQWQCRNKSSTISRSKKKGFEGKVTFQTLWRSLKQTGWTHKLGPEPYGYVYVPPNGSVRIGSVLGKDFFYADDKMWTKAEQMGMFYPESNQPAYIISSPESCSSQRSALTIKTNPSQKPFDEERLCGASLALTHGSIVKITKMISDFLTTTQTCGNFYGDLWVPLWQCIYEQQGFDRKDLRWKYCKSTGAGGLGRNFWFTPPYSNLGSKGEIGIDYFTTEEAVVAFLMRDLDFTGCFAVSRCILDEFKMKLSQAMKEHLPFDEIHLTSNGETRRRIKKRKLSQFSLDESIHDFRRDIPSLKKNKVMTRSKCQSIAIVH